MRKYLICFSAVFLTLLSCSKKEDDTIISPTNSPNILLVIADDLGKDALNGYSEGKIKPTTPHLDNIRNSGIAFNNLWVNPTCSPTRAALITGKYGYSTGVKWAGDILNNSETILHNYIKTQTNNKYSTAVIGKWHLAGDEISNYNPETLGMDYYAGLLSGGGGYTQWVLTEGGENSDQNTYITEKFTDLAINWISEQDKPWFLWLAYTAPHTPFHVPPTEMHSQGYLPAYSQGMDGLPYYLAATETMDYQIGRLLESIPQEELANTTIIFIGDNGTPNQVAQFPYSSTTAKGSLFQGGINTPMLVSGANVSRVGIDDNLISGTDLFATISELAGVNVSEIHDSKSFKSLLSSTSIHREYIYSEMDDGINDMWTIRDSQFKLMVNANGDEKMYDLISDPYENFNLLDGSLSNDQLQVKTVLENKLLEIRK